MQCLHLPQLPFSSLQSLFCVSDDFSVSALWHGMDDFTSVSAFCSVFLFAIQQEVIALATLPETNNRHTNRVNILQNLLMLSLYSDYR